MTDDVIINAETVVIEDSPESEEAWQNEPIEPISPNSETIPATNLPASDPTPEMTTESAAVEVATAAAIVAAAAAETTQEADQTNAELMEIKATLRQVLDTLQGITSPPAAPPVPEESASASEEAIESVAVEAEPVRVKNPPEVPSAPERRREHSWRKNRLRNR